MKKIIIPISTLFVTGIMYAQTTNTENYIRTQTYLEPVTSSSSTAKQIENVQYFDGLGRPKQIVDVKVSPQGKDVVTHVEYDQFGRQLKEYLPVPQSGTQNGAIYTNPLANSTQPDIYGSEKIYSEKVMENSPLDRILEQRQIGNAWNGKPIKFKYETNVDGEVKKYTTTTSWVNNATSSSITLSGTYGTGQLYKNTITDEDGNKSIEFKDGNGQLILVRKVVNDTENADTYYVYNDFGQLAFVIPPLASVSVSLDLTILDNLCYQYHYDNRNRLVEKKVPGKGWEYMVYDKQDRLVLAQDANLRTTTNNNFGGKGWLFTKYDQFGRVVYTGFFTNTATRTAMQTAINNMSSNAGNNEKRTTIPITQNGMDVYYTKDAFPTGSMTILNVNYYDTYPDYSFNPSFPTEIFGKQIMTDNSIGNNTSTNTLPVMNLVKNIEDNNWTKNYTYYDVKGRLAGTYSINHLGGYTKTESDLDFAGIVLQTKVYHKRLNTDVEKIITETFEYDNQNRLLLHKHQVDNNPVEVLAQNKYNELSQLINKKIGNDSQSINYTYNIRGWVTKMNDPLNLGSNLFGYEIKYTNPIYASLTSGSYNGNIAEIDWRSSNDGILKRYTYQYDTLNRLIKGNYDEPENSATYNHYFDEELTYDLNGNIRTLKRFSRPSVGTIPEKIDDLIYNYQNNNLSNKLDKVTLPSGMVNNSSGYNALQNIFGYDDNGNMTNHLDTGKDKIKYNYLNLITETSAYGGNETTKYLYQSNGTKVRRIEELPIFIKYKKITDYLDGFQYETVENDPVGNISTPQLSLKLIPTSEGYYDFEKNSYIYNYKDHLGNIRVSYMYNSKMGIQILDEKSYYPFGLTHSNYSILASGLFPSYNYGYNGKEYQSLLRMNDYGARMYMPELGRWGVIDPLAEQMRRWSPYTYGFDNPIRFIDPDGRNNSDFDRMINDWASGVNAANATPPSTDVQKNKDGTYTVVNAKNDGDNNVYVTNNGKRTGEVIAQTMTPYDFMGTNDSTGEFFFDKKNSGVTFDLNNLGVTASVDGHTIINGDANALLQWGRQIFTNEVEKQSPATFIGKLQILKYLSANFDAKNGTGILDIKSSLGLNKYTPVQNGNTADGKPILTTLRGMGNIIFGANLRATKPSFYLNIDYYHTTMTQVGQYNQKQNHGNGYNSRYPYYGEHTYSGSYIYMGYWKHFYNK
ncbi:DUF6443 domain-containing protein [Chryseobacterium sp. MIQD13]|uniref:DUF6443 domain-containing protein n=1 Tax=Chryseobacterium sp. MIQD13 TaxID=3422310 RepID=UPI003D2BC710